MLPKCFVIPKQISTFAPTKQIIMGELSFELVLLIECQTFIESLPKAVGDKIFYNIHRVQQGERNAELFKKLEGTEIWEFRTLYNKVKYRLFAFWDTETDTMVIATHGIIKKTKKTPQSVIEKAERIRQEYFKDKIE